MSTYTLLYNNFKTINYFKSTSKSDQRQFQGSTQDNLTQLSLALLDSSLVFLCSLALLTILEDLFGHCPTLPRLKGPSWTFMDPQMDPKMDPARLISGDPGSKRAHQGP